MDNICGWRRCCQNWRLHWHLRGRITGAVLTSALVASMALADPVTANPVTASPVTASPALELRLGQAIHRFDVSALQAKVAPATVSVFDPNYRQQKQYRGFPLASVLQVAGAAALQMDDELVLTALDGYSPVLTVAAIQQQQPWLVFAEQTASGQLTSLSAMIQQGKPLDPGPFYLVWPDDATGALPWPYQLVKVELSRFADRFGRVMPQTPVSAEVSHGFALFKQHCLRCHAMNQQGGQVGPELNIPKNVTEYWQASQLPLFIRQVSAFRLNSKMPDFDHLLTTQDSAALVAYLQQMRQQKYQPAK